MKPRIVLGIAAALFAVCIGTLLAAPGNGRHNGWPNHGISEPGEPNYYASPGRWEHP